MEAIQVFFSFPLWVALVFFISLNAMQEICDGINTVQTTLKTVYSILPERIFFWLRADWTIVWSMGAGVFAIGTVIYQQVCNAHHLLA
jgi:hypothetical protein